MTSTVAPDAATGFLKPIGAAHAIRPLLPRAEPSTPPGAVLVADGGMP